MSVGVETLTEDRQPAMAWWAMPNRNAAFLASSGVASLGGDALTRL